MQLERKNLSKVTLPLLRVKIPKKPIKSYTAPVKGEDPDPIFLNLPLAAGKGKNGGVDGTRTWSKKLDGN